MNIGNLEIVKSSGPLEYEFLTLEVLINGEPLIIADQEKGIDALEVELFGRYDDFSAKLPIDDVIAALIEIKKRFVEMNTSAK